MGTEITQVEKQLYEELENPRPELLEKFRKTNATPNPIYMILEKGKNVHRKSNYADTEIPLGRLHFDLCIKAFETMLNKNNDYSYGDDPYNNFRGSKLFHVEPEISILLRMSDKMKRIETFVNSNNLKVKEESAMDACVDIINYAVLLAGLLNERMDKQSENSSA